MQRITLFSVAAVLLLTVTASADLMVYEYVAGEKVTLDTATGKYWYWNLADFVNMTYGEQITAIGGISPTYGNIAGGWNMASLSEMQALYSNSETNIKASFGSALGTDWTDDSIARYDTIPNPPFTGHFVAGRFGGAWFSPGDAWVPDTQESTWLGAWVTTDATVVPVPPAVVLATTGMFTGMLCLMGAKLRCRWRRR